MIADDALAQFLSRTGRLPRVLAVLTELNELQTVGVTVDEDAENRIEELEGELVDLLSPLEQHYAQRRCCPRVRCRLLGTVSRSNERRPAVALDISTNGIAIRSAMNVKPGDRVTITLPWRLESGRPILAPQKSWAPTGHEVVFQGEVAWVQSPGQQSRTGIKFLHERRSSRAIVREYVLTRIRDTLPEDGSPRAS